MALAIMTSHADTQPAPPVATLGSVMKGPGGCATGFDYLRLILAVAVVLTHSIDVTYGFAYGSAVESGLLRPFFAIILPMFFALSGFLVAGSLERCRTLVSFVGLRLIRLLPALIFETALAALLLGPLLTKLPLWDYFQDPLFLGYFANIRGDIRYLLPGLFEANPWPSTVNAQLWTLPYELACYLTLLGLAVLGIHRKRALFVIFTAGLNAALLAQDVYAGNFNPTAVISGKELVLCFLYGIAIYLYRNEIRHSAKLGSLACVLALALLIHPATDYLVPAVAAYLTVYLGLLRPAKTALVTSGDYSYGIFLYGFPVQQAVVQLLGPANQHWYWNLALALPVTLAFAMLSWHRIEEPALALRSQLNKFEDSLLAVSQPPAKTSAV